MIILDTNVLSELFRAAPDQNVERWLGEQNSTAVHLTTVSEAELRYGVAILPEGQRRDALMKAVDDMLRQDFRERILSFDSAAAETYAVIAAERRAVGRPMSQFDCQIAAISRARGATVATRNAKDFEGCGIKVINPWVGAGQ